MVMMVVSGNDQILLLKYRKGIATLLQLRSAQKKETERNTLK